MIATETDLDLPAAASCTSTAPVATGSPRCGTTVLIVHGGEDRVVPMPHGERLARRCRRGELWPRPRDGNISTPASGEGALDWLLARVEDGPGAQN